MTDWPSYWYLTFCRRLSAPEIAQAKSELKKMFPKSNEVRRSELKAAIDSMAMENFGFDQGQKTPSIQALKWHIRHNREPNPRDVFHAEVKRIRAILLKEPDRHKRWDTMCEMTPDTITGSDMCHLLKDLCDSSESDRALVDGIKKRCEPLLPDVDDDRPEGLTDQAWGAEKLWRKGKRDKCLQERLDTNV